MLRDEMIAFEQLSGENAEITSISRIGGFLDGYQKAMEKQQWIPCSERLPEEDGTYFVSGVWKNGDVEVGQLQYIADEHRFSNVIYFNVIAWMPLPEPYKGDANG